MLTILANSIFEESIKDVYYNLDTNSLYINYKTG